MPFDGITIKAVALELKEKLMDARIEKIFMPEKDEVILNLRNHKGSFKLKISVNPSCSGIYITKFSQKNPSVPPNFCMFLRKHISGGKIRNVVFYDYERYISISVESRNELGDMQNKSLIVELTGRICNLVLLNASGKILDALKHVDSDISRVREVMPARNYVFLPPQDKISPDVAHASDILKSSELHLEKAILNTIKGFSPVLCREICSRSGIDAKKNPSLLNDDEKIRFTAALTGVLNLIKENKFSPCVVMDKSASPIDFHGLPLTQYPNLKNFDSINEALDFYFANKGTKARLDLRSADLKKIISRNMKRCRKKVSIHVKIVEKSDSIEDIRLFGELITANIHIIRGNADKVDLLNYYTGEYITIKLDPNKNATQNAQRYFKKYKKAKSAFAHSKIQLEDTRAELEYLDSVSHNLLSCSIPDEVEEIRKELVEQGYVKKKHSKYKKKEAKTKFHPIHYISSEGYDIFAGRNNIENDQLTFKFANSRDLWLHVKGIPGSHVIIRKRDKKEELFPDKTISEAAIVAAYHSRARNSGQVAVDYSEIKYIKKPNNAKPGMVNYFTYHSAYATADAAFVDGMKKD